MFHNEMETISELMVTIKKNTKFIFRQMMFGINALMNQKKKGFMDGYV